MRFRTLMIATAVFAATALPSWAATYYVAPEGATVSSTPDGTKARPWPTVAAAVKRAKAGDTILLMDGSHGKLEVGHSFEADVTIKSENGQNARIESARFWPTAKHIRLANLKIWRNEGDWAGFLVQADKGSGFLTFEGLDVRSRENATDTLNWTADRWKEVAGTGFDLRGRNYVLRNNTIRGVKTGINAGGRSLVEDNVIDGFRGDGMKGVHNSTFRRNLVMNKFNVKDGYHSDGFQSYAPGGVSGLTLDSNTIIEWTHAPDHPLRGWLQGMGLFDGPYTDLLIENNLVVVRHSHGISVYGAYQSKVVNNTVVSLSGKPSKYPILRVRRQKDGTPSQDVRIANNLAMGFEGGNPATNHIFSDNSIILDPAAVFQDVSKFDYRPKATSGFIDRGNPDFAPAADIMNMRRPYAKGPDRGAFEVGSTATVSAPSTTEGVGKWLTPR